MLRFFLEVVVAKTLLPIVAGIITVGVMILVMHFTLPWGKKKGKV